MSPARPGAVRHYQRQNRAPLSPPAKRILKSGRGIPSSFIVHGRSRETCAASACVGCASMCTASLQACVAVLAQMQLRLHRCAGCPRMSPRTEKWPAAAAAAPCPRRASTRRTELSARGLASQRAHFLGTPRTYHDKQTQCAAADAEHQCLPALAARRRGQRGRLLREPRGSRLHGVGHADAGPAPAEARLGRIYVSPSAIGCRKYLVRGPANPS